MPNQEKPTWMSDSLVADIDPGKLDFLQSIVFETKGKSQKELLPFLMNVVKRGKASNVSFSDAEMNSIMTAIKKNSTPEELVQIDKFAAMYKSGMFSNQKRL